MRRSILIAIFALIGCGTLSAQRFFVLDSEKVFKSLAEYNAAIASLDSLSKRYQQQVDAEYAACEKLYNQYMAQRESLAATSRQTIEQQILDKEEKAGKLQEQLFGPEGELMKRRVELIEPIQKRVFAAIESYSKAQGYDLAIDKASNVSVLYSSQEIDHTQKIIDMLK